MNWNNSEIVTDAINELWTIWKNSMCYVQKWKTNIQQQRKIKCNTQLFLHCIKIDIDCVATKHMASLKSMYQQPTTNILGEHENRNMHVNVLTQNSKIHNTKHYVYLYMMVIRISHTQYFNLCIVCYCYSILM